MTGGGFDTHRSKKLQRLNKIPKLSYVEATRSTIFSTVRVRSNWQGCDVADVFGNLTRHVTSSLRNVLVA